MNSFNTIAHMEIDHQLYRYHSLQALGRYLGVDIDRYPYSWKILIENLLRHEDGEIISRDGILKILDAFENGDSTVEVPFYPSRVILQDFTGVPVMVDLAAMRNVMHEWNLEPSLISPSVPTHLVIDHSVQVDAWACDDALKINMKKEFERNEERYRFLKWAQNAFDNFFVVPPGKGIIHQINVEHLANLVWVSDDEPPMVFPDTVVGTDSHTTMVNGLGVVGWGVGGIEAEAVMLGQPYYFPVPEIVGVNLVGSLPPKATATDVALLITETLRKIGVVGKFVEFFGPAWSSMSLSDRATIANMAPEYGATMGFCPVDEETISFLGNTGKRKTPLNIVERYLKKQGLFGGYPDPAKVLFSDVIEIDLSKAVPSLAGPKRPQDRVDCEKLSSIFSRILTAPKEQFGYGLDPDRLNQQLQIQSCGNSCDLRHGSVVIASITSCTNTSNPELIITAALLAKNAAQKGVKPKPWVKTSFSPGSRITTEYLKNLGLLKSLETLGFHVTCYGCATCIGNSGPLPEALLKAIEEGELVVCAVVSANRNFEGRVHESVRANFLASPPLVVAYALSGRIDIDWNTEPLGYDSHGNPVFLKDIWPRRDEIKQLVEKTFDPVLFEKFRAKLFVGDNYWNDIVSVSGSLFEWDVDSTYLRRPLFLESVPFKPFGVKDIRGARVLLYLGDSITTDHISPAGTIPPESPAGRYLTSKGVSVEEFNSYGSRRGNHEVMVRGTFANIRLKNKLVPNRVGGWTVHIPSGKICSVWEAAEKYRQENIPLIVIAGREYGTGSSRDWAAKGTAMLGVKAVIAQSFERIHRSNLVGMGVLPLQFMEGQSPESLGLKGDEVFDICGILENMTPNAKIKVVAKGTTGIKEFYVISRLDTGIEVSYFLNGGILPKVLREIGLKAGRR